MGVVKCLNNCKLGFLARPMSVDLSQAGPHNIKTRGNLSTVLELRVQFSSVQFILLTQESLYRPMSRACNILKQASGYKHTVTVRISKTI